MNSQLARAQLDILRYLYRFRFLTSHQLQYILKQKTIRLTNYHLQFLTNNHYIAKHYTRTLGLGNTPAVYYLASGSIPVIKDFPRVTARTIKRIYRERLRSQQFIDHAVYLADYFLFLRNDSETTYQTLHFFTKTDLEAHPYFLHPLPDAYFARVSASGETKRYMFEVIEDSSPRFAIRKRVDQYNDYIESGKFEEATEHPFPSILFVCPGIASLIYLKKHLSRVYDETSLDQASIYLATHEQALKGIWESAEPSEN